MAISGSSWFIGQANFLTGTLMGSEIALDGGIGTLSPAQPPRFRDGARLLLACRPEAVALDRPPQLDDA